MRTPFASRWFLFGTLLAACGGGGEGADAGLADGASPTTDGETPMAEPQVTTTSGALVGARGEGHVAFLGVPYAEPPLGDLRWRPPVPFTSDAEIRTTGRPMRCAQSVPGFPLPSSEDCLYLNVHAPDPLPEGAPVMVWIHGGAFVLGEGAQTDGGTLGDLLASQHGVVVVSMNYRLGAFGFLAHPELTAEGEGASGNYGLMDQRLALEWVRDNIAAFGGDPSNVTIFGESAGGFSVCAHLISPESEGLFHRAISQSGLCESDIASLEAAEASGLSYAANTSCPAGGGQLECLRGLSQEDLIEADAAGGSVLSSFDEEGAWFPIADGRTLTMDFRAAVAAGAHADVPTVIGWTADEGTLFVMLAEQAGMVADEAAYDAVVPRIAAFAGVEAAAIRAQYPVGDYPDPGGAIADLIGDLAIACPSRRAARLLADAGGDVRVYRFDYPEAAFQLPSTRDLGAFHSAEIQYIFGHPSQIGVRAFRGAADRALNDAMSAYWAEFAAGSGEPAGLPAWPAYTTADDAHLVLDAEVTTGAGAHEADCALWDSGRE